MQNKKLIVLFMVLNLVVFGLYFAYPHNIFLLALGHLFIFTVTLVSHYVNITGLKSSNPHAWVRGVYGSLLIKFFVVSSALLCYCFVNKGTPLPIIPIGFLISCYFAYTALDTYLLLQEIKNK